MGAPSMVITRLRKQDSLNVDTQYVVIQHGGKNPFSKAKVGEQCTKWTTGMMKLMKLVKWV